MGRSTTCLVSNPVAMLAFSVWTSATSAVTSTSSWVPFTINVMSTSDTWPTMALSFSSGDFRAGLSAVIVYSPGFSSEKRYSPLSWLTAFRISLVSVLLSVTVAPGTTAPLESFTTPVTSPVVIV